LDLVAIAIIGVFGAILAVFLYEYLLESPEYKEKKAERKMEKPMVDEVDSKEALAEKVYIVMQKFDGLEKKVADLDAYLSQVVDIWRKRAGEEKGEMR